MKSLFTALAFTILLIPSASAQVISYITEQGEKYTSAEKDSIANLGYPISIKKKEIKNDSTIYTIEILEKQQGKTAFQEKFENKLIPSLVLTDLDGKEIDLSARGKAMMINIWSTTCGPCIVEIPQLNQLKKKYDTLVQFIGIAPENKQTISSFLERHSFEFDLVCSPKFFEDFNIDSYPRNLFVDKNGIVVTANEGTPLKKVDGEWRVSVLESYSEILDKVLLK